MTDTSKLAPKERPSMPPVGKPSEGIRIGSVTLASFIVVVIGLFAFVVYAIDKIDMEAEEQLLLATTLETKDGQRTSISEFVAKTIGEAEVELLVLQEKQAAIVPLTQQDDIKATAVAKVLDLQAQSYCTALHSMQYVNDAIKQGTVEVAKRPCNIETLSAAEVTSSYQSLSLPDMAQLAQDYLGVSLVSASTTTADPGAETTNIEQPKSVKSATELQQDPPAKNAEGLNIIGSLEQIRTQLDGMVTQAGDVMRGLVASTEGYAQNLALDIQQTVASWWGTWERMVKMDSGSPSINQEQTNQLNGNSLGYMLDFFDSWKTYIFQFSGASDAKEGNLITSSS
ncbi:MAG: hypothetical protein ACPGJH_07935 [Alphaproteobacteria bacterium]